MKDSERYEFKGSGVVQLSVFVTIIGLKYFGVINISWLLATIVAFVGCAILPAIISTITKS